MDNGRQKFKKTFTLTLLLIILCHTLVHVAGSIRYSIFPVIKQEFRLTNWQIGIIAAIPPLCQALVTLPAGILADKLRARLLMVVSLAMAALGTLIAGFTYHIGMFIIATSLLALSSTIYHPPANSYISKDTPVEDRPKALGVFTSGGILGFAIGSFSVTIFMDFLGFNWRTLYLLWFFPTLLPLVGLYFVPPYPRSPASTSSNREKRSEGDLQLLTTSMMLFLFFRGVRRFGRGMTVAFLSIYLVESRSWGLGLVAIMIGAGRLIGMGASSLGGTLATRFGEKRWAVMTLSFSYTFFLAAFLAPSMLLFFFLYLLYRFVGMLGTPVLSAITARLSPREKRGRGYALSFLPSGIVRTIAPIVAGFIASFLGLFPIFIISAMIFYMGVVILEFGVKLK